jgi:hypothetical protein
VAGGLRLAAGFLVAGFLGFIYDTPQHQKVREAQTKQDTSDRQPCENRKQICETV